MRWRLNNTSLLKKIMITGNEKTKQNRNIILSRDIIYDSFAKTTFFPQRCDSSVGYSMIFFMLMPSD